MEDVILSTLLKTDEYTINEMCRSSTAIRNVCKKFKITLAKYIIEERVKNTTIDLKRVYKEYKNYATMLVEWKKWGRSKHIEILDPELDEDDIYDPIKANESLDKPENESIKKSLIRGDILSINYKRRKHNIGVSPNRPESSNRWLYRNRNEGKFIFDGEKLESLDSDQDEEGNVPKSYLVIDEFHIRYWEDTISHNTFVPVIFPEPKSIASTELGNAFFYTFEINNKTFYLFLYYRYDVPITPNISFNKVNFVSTDEIESDEFPELEDIFSKTNSENFFSLEQLSLN
jgi:hypothetical protein